MGGALAAATKGSRPPTSSSTKGSRPATPATIQERFLYRVRIEGLSRFFLHDVLEQQVYRMLRGLQAPTPAQLLVVADPISERPLGYAYVDFWQEEHALLVASCRAVQLAGGDAATGYTTVRLIREGPRPQSHDPVQSLRFVFGQ